MSIALAVTELRYKAVDFAFPLYEGPAMFIYKVPSKDGGWTHNFYFIKPFKSTLWVMIGLMVVIVGTFSHIMGILATQKPCIGVRKGNVFLPALFLVLHIQVS